MNTTPQHTTKDCRVFVAVVMAVLLIGYVTSYYHFTRPWLTTGGGLVLYTASDGNLTRADMIQHSLLSVCYAPLNWLDHQVLGTSRPPRCILLELS